MTVFCKDCRHHEWRSHSGPSCLATKKDLGYNLVTGYMRTEILSCEMAREPLGPCGLKGKLYELLPVRS
jgi:hypothetical protein